MPQRLAATIDGAPLSDDDARALWTKFSAFMEEHRGDLAGFAAQEGFASVHPEMRDGQAVLVASRTAPQRPYASAARGEDDAGGAMDERRSGEPSPIHAPARAGGKKPGKARRKSR